MDTFDKVASTLIESERLIEDQRGALKSAMALIEASDQRDDPIFERLRELVKDIEFRAGSLEATRITSDELLTGSVKLEAVKSGTGVPALRPDQVRKMVDEKAESGEIRRFGY